MKFDSRTSRAFISVILLSAGVALTLAHATAQGVQRQRRITATPVTQAVAKFLQTEMNRPDVDLRPEIASLGIAIRNQGNRGTCSVFALTFLLDFMYAKNNINGVRTPELSEEFLNYASNLAVGEKADGGFFDQLDLGYQKYGMVGEALAPYQPTFRPNLSYPSNVMAQGASLRPRFKANFIKPWNVTTGLSPIQLQSILVQLRAGRAVAGGLRWPSAATLPTQTIAGVTMMKAVPASQVFDGHSIDFVGFKASQAFPGGGYLIFRNQWGTGFMDQGYGFMSFEYAAKYTNDLVEYVKR